MTNAQGQDGLQVVSKLMVLEAGLHIFRIAEAHITGTTFLGLSATPIGQGKVDFFPAEGVSMLTLKKTGDCIIVRVAGEPAGVLITEYKIGPGGGEIKLRVDRVATHFPASGISQPHAGGASPVQPSAMFSPNPGAMGLPPLPTAAPPPMGAICVKALGHITGHGDVIASDNWLGDPNGSTALEGFAVKVIGLPADVKLAYVCRASGTQQLQPGRDGEFVGSRGNNRRINALGFSLEGPGAKQFKIGGVVTFLMSGPIDIEDGIMLQGAGASDSLQAFRLVIAPMDMSTEGAKGVRQSFDTHQTKPVELRGEVSKLTRLKTSQKKPSLGSAKLTVKNTTRKNTKTSSSKTPSRTKTSK